MLLTPPGYQPAYLEQALVGTTPYFEDGALLIEAEPGEAVLMISNEKVETGTQTVQLSLSVFASSPQASLALIGLSAPIDGQIGYNEAQGGGIPPLEQRVMTLLYEPPGQALHLGLQVANPHNATETVQVLFDRLQVRPFFHIERKKVPLQPDGNFESDLKNLITNVNQVRGSVQSVREIGGDRAIQLSIEPGQIAANAGAGAKAAEFYFPSLFLGTVEVKRLLGSGGTLAFVLTNGLNTIAVFENGSNLLPLGSPRTFLLGGSLETVNPLIPPMLLFQNAGNEKSSSILIDDLELSQVLQHNLQDNASQ